MSVIQKTFDEHREGILYLLFGAFTVLVSLLSFKLFVYVGVSPFFSNILSWCCAVFFAFVVNKWFVFSSKSTEKKVLFRESVSFLGARIFTLAVSIVMFQGLCEIGLSGEFMGTQDFLPKIITSGVEIVLNWMLSKYAVFIKKSKQTA